MSVVLLDRGGYTKRSCIFFFLISTRSCPSLKRFLAKKKIISNKNFIDKKKRASTVHGVYLGFNINHSNYKAQENLAKKNSEEVEKQHSNTIECEKRKF